MTSQGQQTLGSKMRIDENAEFTVVGLGSEGILEGSYNVINEYAIAKSERPGDRGHWAYISIPNYDVFRTLVIGKTGENTVSDTNFNLQLGLTQLYIEAHAELKEAVKVIRDVIPESKAEQDKQDQALKECRNNLHEVTTGLRNSWDLQAALHVWRAHWQGGRPQKRFDHVLYREILDAWKLLRDKMGEGDDLVGVGWLDSWIKGFLDVYSYEDDFYQQLLTWNMVHDVGDADFGHESIRLWQAEINKFRYKHRKVLDIESTMAGIKERMAQFRVMIMDPGSYHGWAAGGWYWQVKTDQFRSLATQLMDLDFRQRLQQQPESQHKFEELDRLALDIYKNQMIETCKRSKKSLQAVQMIEIWHSTFGLLINYDMICTGYLWSYIRSTSQMDTDVFILSYQDVEVKKGGWTCPITVELIAAFQIGLRGFIKRRAESRARRKRNSRPKPKPSAQGEGESKTTSSKSPIQEQKCSDAGRFEDAELIHDDGKKMEPIPSTPLKKDEEQSRELAMYNNESETANIKKKKKKSSKKKPQTSAEGIPALPILASTGDLVRVGTGGGELAPDIKNSAETTDIDDAWQAAKQEFIGRITSEDGSLTKESQENTGMAGFLKDAERSKMMDLPEVAGVRPPSAKAVSAFDWFDETNEPTASTNDEWYSVVAKQIQREGSQSRTTEDNSLKENNKLRPGVQWSQIVGGGTKTNVIEEVLRPKKHKQVANVPKFPKAVEKSPSSIPRFDGQSQKKSNIASDRRKKEKPIVPSKAVPPPQKEMQGPIGHILPSVGPWTEVSKKRKQVVVVVGGSENSAGRDRIIGNTKAKIEAEIGDVTKISGGPAVGEFKMKEISNLLDSSGKRQSVTKITELDSQPAPPSVLRIVPKQVQFPAPTSPTGTADPTKNVEVPSSSLVLSDVRPVIERTVNHPSLNPPDGSQEDHWGVAPALSPDQSVKIKILTTDPPIVLPTADQTVSVQYKTGQVAPTARSATELPAPLSPTTTNADAAEECQTLLTISVQDIVSPSALGDTDVPVENSDHSREGSKKGLDSRDEVFEGETGSGESTDPTEMPGIH